MRKVSGLALAAVLSMNGTSVLAQSVYGNSGAQGETVLAGAEQSVAKLATERGFYAGNDYRQYWTRDLGYSVDVLVGLGYADTVEAHLKQILKNQKPSGEIPAMVQTRAGVIHDVTHPELVLRSYKYRGVHFLDDLGEYISNYHGVEADNPVIFLTTLKTYERLTGRNTFSGEYEKNIDEILKLIETLTGNNGLIPGSGWVDAMENYRGKYMLLNQVWLYKMYREFDMREKMQAMRSALEAFWDGKQGFYVDYLGGNRFDTLANALLMDEDLVPMDRVKSILAMLSKVRGKYGYVNLYPPYTIGECSEYPYQYQNSTVWPFVEYRLAKVFKKYGMIAEARQIKSMMEARKGFNEWYSPVNGKPGGSKTQLWTASAYVGVSNLVGASAK